MRAILNRIIPFIYLGIALVALVVGLILFSYLLIFGAIVGFVVFAIVRIREMFFSSKKPSSHHKTQQRSGRTIEHDDKS